MNPIGRLAVLVVAAALFAGGAFFAYQKIQQPVNRPADPTQLGRAPDFTLTHHSGESFSSTQVDSTVRVIDFFFTRCKGICPVLTERMQELADILEPHRGWALISISVDPEHDTPEVLRTYRQQRGIDSPNWHFLTGTEAEVRTLIRDGFKLPVQDNPDNPDEPILHSPRMVLLDAQGNFRGFYDAFDEEAMAGLKRDAVQLLQ